MNQTYSDAVPLDTLTPHPDNPREGDIGLISQLITTNGWYGALIVQEGTNRILVGNHRYRAAQQLGAKELPAFFLDADDEQALRIMLGDNGSTDAATYDDVKLAELLRKLATTPPGLNGTARDADDLDALMQRITEPLTTPTSCTCCGRPYDG